jgi:GNAT superfamily N-acetyltransferase
MSLFRRAGSALREHGVSGLTRRLRTRLLAFTRSDNLVLRLDASTPRSPAPSAAGDAVRTRAMAMAERLRRSFEFRRVAADDSGELEALAALDPWRISAERSARMLREGWIGYVATLAGRIVASGWAFTGTNWYNYDLARTLVMAPGEVYHSRTFCAPDYRGRGVLLWLSKAIVADVAATVGATSHLGVVDPANGAMHRSLVAAGWSVVGRMGFVEGWGCRLHYIRGRRAFPAMRRRVLLERVRD